MIFCLSCHGTTSLPGGFHECDVSLLEYVGMVSSVFIVVGMLPYATALNKEDKNEHNSVQDDHAVFGLHYHCPMVFFKLDHGLFICICANNTIYAMYRPIKHTIFTCDH